MAFIVEMYAKAWTPEFREFRCHEDTWGKMLDLAHAYGWKPAGTVPFNAIMANPESEPSPGIPRGDYKPKDVSETAANALTAKDAAALADALEKAKRHLEESSEILPRTGPMILKDGMSAGDHRQVNADISPEYLGRFIFFLRKGGFGFSWDD